MRQRSILLLIALFGFISIRSDAGDQAAGLPDWCVGPFTRPPEAKPIIKPDPASVFNCPMRKIPVHWEAAHTFNPAAVVKDGKIYVLYRAEDDLGHGIGGYTSRLGLAVSEDGINFKKMPEPVLYPAEDDQKGNEWEGGCEDPRVVEMEDGTYSLFYTEWMRLPGKRKARLGLATSKDLIHWTKLGPVVAGKIHPSKSASLVCRVVGDRLVAAKINGRYWLYFGEGAIQLLSSPDLRTWEPASGVLLDRRPGKFDADLAECGPPALMTSKGIVLMYNGKNGKALDDIGVGHRAYSGGQALFSATDPSHLIDRTDVPFIKPELPWEKSGQYTAGTTFIEGLVLFKHQWFLYYGCADTYVGVAVAPYHPI